MAGFFIALPLMDKKITRKAQVLHLSRDRMLKFFCCYFAAFVQLSFRPTVLLNTNFSGVLSLSTQK